MGKGLPLTVPRWESSWKRCSMRLQCPDYHCRAEALCGEWPGLWVTFKGSLLFGPWPLSSGCEQQHSPPPFLIRKMALILGKCLFWVTRLILPATSDLTVTERCLHLRSCQEIAQGVPMEVLYTRQNLPLTHQRPFSRKLTDFWLHYRACNLEGEHGT